VSVLSRFGLRTNFDLFYVSLSRRPELNITSVEDSQSSCSAERVAIKYSENVARPEVDFDDCINL